MKIQITVQPNAKKNEVFPGEKPKVRITAPPVDGKANEELCRFLAEFFKIAKNQVRIVAGLSSRQKLIELPDEAGQKLLAKTKE